MSLQIVQNQQLKPIGDKVPIDTTLSSSSENAISNKVVSDEITRINSDLTDLTTLMGKTCTFTNIASSSGYRCIIIPISKNLGLCVFKATLVPTATSITYTIPKATYGADINAIMAGLANVGNVAISLGQNGTAGEMFTGTRAGLTANAAYVIDTCYVVAI